MPARPLLFSPHAETSDGPEPRLDREGGPVNSRVTGTDIRERLAVVHGNIQAAQNRSGRSGERVRVLVATKYYAPEQLAGLAEAGVDLVGENRAEDLVEKQERFGDRFEWHFIGHLQRRKARIVVPRVTLVHSVDSVRLIGEISKRAPEGGADVLVQV